MENTIHPRAQTILTQLLDGNQRFLNGFRSIHSMATPEKLQTLAKSGQQPSCIVLTCSDSRVPAELIFDQGLGDLFVIRVAGNVVAPSLIASMEFAVLNFKSPLILVLGHTQCGAIKAACDYHQEANEFLSHNLKDLILRILPSVRKSQEENKCQHQSLQELVEFENVRNSISKMKEESQILQSKIINQELSIVGAIFELATGKVKLTEESKLPYRFEETPYPHQLSI